MRSLFYPKLAFQNIGKNRRFYLPYFVTCIFTVAMFYDLLFLANNRGYKDMFGGDTLLIFLNMGTVIVGIFSAIFLFYTNSFLIKSRKKELGLYNILGMTKLNIAHVLVWETFITAVICLFSGLVLGITVSKLLLLLLGFILNFDMQIGFSVSAKSIEYTLILFAAIFLLTLIYNLACIRLSKPVELLKGGSVGEKEPKAKWITAILGFLALGGGYYIAVIVEDPVAAVLWFFVAVILVIIGTYFLFTSGSIAVLKIMRKNRKYYYKAKHFTSVSGMLYRMKQNAAGLSNICILSTMVLVMLSGTVCLYVGMEDILNRSAPYDITIVCHPEADGSINKEKPVEIAEKTAEEKGLKISGAEGYESFEVAMLKDGADYKFPKSQEELRTSFSVAVVGAARLSDYNRFTGENVMLQNDEALGFYTQGSGNPENVNLDGKSYNVSYLDDMPGSERFSSYAMDVFCLVLNDAEYESFFQRQAEIYKEQASKIEWQYAFDLSGTPEEKIDCCNALEKGLNSQGLNCSVVSREITRLNAYGMYGGLFFVGLFLGFLFIGFTALMIYYKQISEGYEDKQRFQIMQKVGMSKAEVRKSINSQVLKVFFLPLIAAVVHLIFAFGIITKLLALMGMVNTRLFVFSVIGTVAVFALIYFLIFHFTARTYYKIVNS